MRLTCPCLSVTGCHPNKTVLVLRAACLNTVALQCTWVSSATLVVTYIMCKPVQASAITGTIGSIVAFTCNRCTARLQIHQPCSLACAGPSMMPGGTQEAYTHIKDIVEKVAAQVNDGPCVTYIGPGGAGNFVKMVHNGIEYGDMQLISEAYDVLRTLGGFTNEELTAAFNEWNKARQAAVCRVLFRVYHHYIGAPQAQHVLRTPGGFQPTRSVRRPCCKTEQGAQAAARLCTFRTRAVACPGGRAYGWGLAGQAAETHYCKLFDPAAGRFAACIRRVEFLVERWNLQIPG